MGTISYFRLQYKIIAHSFPVLPVAVVSLALLSLGIMGHWAVATDQRPLTIVRSGRAWCCSLLAHSEGGCLRTRSVLFQVLAYSCVYSYYNQDTESMDIVEQQTESLELLTNALQILLGKSCGLFEVVTSISSCIQRAAAL